MPHAERTNEIDLDRERIECVFGLGGGELHEPHPDFRDSEGWDGPDGIAYWYEGIPEYTSLVDLGLTFDDEVRTAILDVMFGFPDSPEGWGQVASFRSSGEANCWWCAQGAENGTDNEDQRDACTLCEGDGLIYLGDGMAEVVYRRALAQQI